jgi:hypothetical protein
MNSTVKRLALVGIAFAMLVSVVPGGVVAQDGGGDEQVDLDNLVTVYNDNVDAAPSIARGRFASETLEVRIGQGDSVATAESGTVYYFTTDSDGVVTDYGPESAEDPGIRVRTSQQTFDAILEAEDPAAEFNAQYEAGNVKVSGLTLTKSVEVEITKFAVWLGKTFGLI